MAQPVNSTTPLKYLNSLTWSRTWTKSSHHLFSWLNLHWNIAELTHLCEISFSVCCKYSIALCGGRIEQEATVTSCLYPKHGALGQPGTAVCPWRLSSLILPAWSHMSRTTKESCEELAHAPWHMEDVATGTWLVPGRSKLIRGCGCSELETLPMSVTWTWCSNHRSSAPPLSGLPLFHHFLKTVLLLWNSCTIKSTLWKFTWLRRT